LNSVDASHQNRSWGDEQLDDGIGNTLVSALLLMSACHISSYLQTEPRSTLRMVLKILLICVSSGWCRRFRIEINLASAWPLPSNWNLSFGFVRNAISQGRGDESIRSIPKHGLDIYAQDGASLYPKGAPLNILWGICHEENYRSYSLCRFPARRNPSRLCLLQQ
jgi:hypothetical protein